MLIRQKLYDKLFANELNDASTTNLYKLTLEKLDDNLKILDVGVGTGVYFENKECINLIKSKNLKIHGIDINKDDINLAKSRIINNDLNLNVFVEYKDLFELKNINDYDVIIYSESYPVISKDLMFKMLDFIINKNKFKNKLIFINNIEDNPTFIQQNIKPYLKYFLGIDFGRLVTKNDMKETFNYIGINENFVTYELLSYDTPNNIFFRNKIKLPFFDFKMNQYLITVNLK
jgi:hypothetical protein